jgi:arylformamidase
MSSQYIDITFPISSKLPAWPGSIGFTYQWHMEMGKGATNNLSSFTIDSHLGTHLDAPLHFVHNGKVIQDLDLDVLIGEVYIAEIRGKRSITDKDLDSLAIPADCKRLLLKTDNQVYWESGEAAFQEDFCSIDISGAEWVVAKGIKLIGIDYLSIQRFHDGPEVHQVLLNAEVVIVETLNLQNVAEGRYELICLPLKMEELEGAPVRAVLKKYN